MKLLFQRILRVKNNKLNKDYIEEDIVTFLDYYFLHWFFTDHWKCFEHVVLHKLDLSWYFQNKRPSSSDYL